MLKGGEGGGGGGRKGVGRMIICEGERTDERKEG